MRPVRTVLKSDPDFDPEDTGMEFRLTYEGRLLGASRSNTRAEHKHEIRRVFHRQLRQLWINNPHLNIDVGVVKSIAEMGRRVEAGMIGHEKPSPPLPTIEYLADSYSRCGYRFVPLVHRALGVTCGVRILFLRADPPGQVLRSGDIDNRLKTLFDSLRIIHNGDELGSYKTPQPDEDPFFCLLEDDSLINHLSVETDTLLQPTGQTLDANDARLVITVSIKPIGATLLNMAFN